MALFAYFGRTLRRSGHGAAVTAFSLATRTTTLSAASASSASSANAGASRSFVTAATASGQATQRRAFYRAMVGSTTCPAPTSTGALRMSSAATLAPELAQAMGVEHPAYEIISEDFVEEYGAATTLYRHKKSGAELLSVSSDDDNKVFGITFRTPREYSLVVLRATTSTTTTVVVKGRPTTSKPRFLVGCMTGSDP